MHCVRAKATHTDSDWMLFGFHHSNQAGFDLCGGAFGAYYGVCHDAKKALLGLQGVCYTTDLMMDCNGGWQLASLYMRLRAVGFKRNCTITPK